MSFIEMSFDGVKEPKPVSAGRYDLVCSDVSEMKKDKNGHDYLVLTLEITDHDDAPSVRHSLFMPSGEDPKKDQYKKLDIMRTLYTLHVPYENGFNPEDLVGAAGFAQLTLSEPDEQGRQFNRFIPDKIPDQTEAPATGRRRRG